jgi:hypothetical protein
VCRASLCMCLDKQDLRKTLVQECWVGADIWSHSAQARIVQSTGVSKWPDLPMECVQHPISPNHIEIRGGRRSWPYLAVQHNLFRCVTWFEPGLHIWAASKVSGTAALLLSDDGKSPGNSIWSYGNVLWNTAIKMLLMLRSNWLPLPFDGVHQR